MHGLLRFACGVLLDAALWKGPAAMEPPTAAVTTINTPMLIRIVEPALLGRLEAHCCVQPRVASQGRCLKLVAAKKS
jgi:hypothetical protein